jgi:N-acyl-D-amino-acid deacylase
VFLKHPVASVCLDSRVYDKQYQNPRPPYSLPKEGTFDGFTTVLEKYVKKQDLLSIEEAIQKLSTNAAKAYKIKKRGMLKKGYFADVLVMDWDKLQVRSDSLDPRRYPQGVEYVFVNGKKTVEKGKHTKARAGKILRKS